MIQDQTTSSPTAPRLPDSADQTADASASALVSEAQLVALAEAMSETAQAGDVFALRGALGAGKSTFARAFIRAAAERAGTPADEVPSPTFTLVQTYPAADLTLWHFDLYRIGDPEEIWELGIEEALADGVCLIEWPERAEGLLPARRVEIGLEHVPDVAVRKLTVSNGTPNRALSECFNKIVQSLMQVGASS